MSQELIDQGTFDELADAMGTEFAAELVETFLSDAPNMFADLKEAFGAEDADAYRRAAHSIKSNAQVFGAKRLADQAREMELGDMASGGAAIAELEATFTQTATALKGLLDE